MIINSPLANGKQQILPVESNVVERIRDPRCLETLQHIKVIVPRDGQSVSFLRYSLLIRIKISPILTGQSKIAKSACSSRPAVTIDLNNQLACRGTKLSNETVTLQTYKSFICLYEEKQFNRSYSP